MGGGFPLRDRTHNNNHRREITMLIFVAPQGVVWWGYWSSEGPHITRGLLWLTIINDQKRSPSATPLPTVDPKSYSRIILLHLSLTCGVCEKTQENTMVPLR